MTDGLGRVFGGLRTGVWVVTLANTFGKAFLESRSVSLQCSTTRCSDCNRRLRARIMCIRLHPGERRTVHHTRLNANKHLARLMLLQHGWK